MNKKHLSLSDRIEIESLLNQNMSFRKIAEKLDKSHTTISREVQSKLVFKQTGAWGNSFNDCLHRFDCTNTNLCSYDGCKHKKCSRCKLCHKHCPDYIKQRCDKLDSAPFVCNGCTDKRKCTLEKRFYSAKSADLEYQEILCQSRQGINLTEERLNKINTIVSPLIKQGQSIGAVYANHKDTLMLSEKTLYNYLNQSLFDCNRLDQPRAVRYKPRKSKKPRLKIDRKCRQNRTYDDYVKYIKRYPDVLTAQMDTVIGRRGGKTLLTLHFPVPKLMLAFLMDDNTSASVIKVFDMLYTVLGKTAFKKLFRLILTDNGSEFSNPSALEYDQSNNKRTRIFYCNPYASYEKGALENNHEFIRRILPKGTSFDALDQNDINLMMSHINSYVRKDLGNKTPIDVFHSLYGKNKLEKMGIFLIPHDKVTIRPSLLKNNN